MGSSGINAVLGWADKNNLKMFIDQDKNNKKRVDKTIKFVNRHKMIGGTNEINKERDARRNLIAIEEEEEKESEEKISKEKSEKYEVERIEKKNNVAPSAATLSDDDANQEYYKQWCSAFNIQWRTLKAVNRRLFERQEDDYLSKKENPDKSEIF